MGDSALAMSVGAEPPARPSALAFVGSIGAVAGMALAGRRRWLGAVGGATTLMASEALARRRQRPNEIPALPHRILVSGAMAAPVGWAAGRFVGPVAVGTGAGAIAGLFGFRPQKVTLGPVFGAAMGQLLATASPVVSGAVVAAITVTTYRTV